MMPHRLSSPRFWTLYALAWLPYLGLLTLLFLGEGGDPWQGLWSASTNVLPAALLGVAVLAGYRRWLWPLRERQGRWGWWLVAGGLVYSALYVAGMIGIMLLEALWLGGELQVQWMWMPWWAATGLMLYTMLIGVAHALVVTGELRRERERLVLAEAARAQAELVALRARLDPHFLFNTLHSLLALVRQDRRQQDPRQDETSAAEEALEQFGDLLRYALRVQTDDLDRVPLASEWRFVEKYLALERLRLGDRLKLTCSLDDDALEVPVPVFCLQPLVENALRHAVAPRVEGGCVTLEARRVDGRLRLRVADDGPGMDVAEVSDGADGNGSEGKGVGLATVRRRLEVLYAERASFEVASRPGQGFEVVLTLPVDDEDEA